MPRFLIEIPHSPTKTDCLRELNAYLQDGAHYLTNAEWGCLANDHRAVLQVDVTTDVEAKMLVPPFARNKAKVTPISRFTPDQIREMAGHLQN